MAKRVDAGAGCASQELLRILRREDGDSEVTKGNGSVEVGKCTQKGCVYGPGFRL